jgi:hypothetical protein
VLKFNRLFVAYMARNGLKTLVLSSFFVLECVVGAQHMVLVIFPASM